MEYLNSFVRLRDRFEQFRKNRRLYYISTDQFGVHRVFDNRNKQVTWGLTKSLCEQIVTALNKKR